LRLLRREPSAAWPPRRGNGPPAIETATMSSMLRSSRVQAGMHKLAGTIGWAEAVRAALRLITCGS